MKAIILVAGYATRLYPLTLHTPKALLTIADRPIMDYIMDEIDTVDAIDTVYVVSNNKFYEHFSDWAKTSASPKRIRVLNDGTNTIETRLGAIGDILFAIQQENIDDDIVVMAGDNFFTYAFKDYYDFYKANGKDCVCVKKMENKEELKRLGVATLDDENRVIRLVEKPAEPESDMAVFATYFFKKETLPMFAQYLHMGNNPDAPGNFIAWLYKETYVKAYVFDGECYDIGTPEAYQEIQEIVGRSKRG